jgi:hypothetical protein
MSLELEGKHRSICKKAGDPVISRPPRRRGQEAEEETALLLSVSFIRFVRLIAPLYS